MNITVTYQSELEDDVDESTLSEDELMYGVKIHNLELPAKMEVCDDCEGHGFVLNPSMREHAYSMEEFNETFHDEEDREQYFKRGGIYDIQCPTCNGKNVVPVVDESLIPSNKQEQYKQYKMWKYQKDRDDYLYRKECEYQRRFGF